MTALSWPELRMLLEHRDTWCVSLFLPTHRAGAVTWQDPVRFRNLLRDAERQLASRGLREPEIAALLAPALDLANEGDFWQHQMEGLAVFLAPGVFREVRLPFPLYPEVAVDPRFRIRPLLPALTADGVFYVLALSRNRNRLYRASRTAIQPVTIPGVPAGLDEAARPDAPEPQPQFRGGAGAAGDRGRRSGLFHGHGGGNDGDKTRLMRYFQQIDRGLRKLLREERAPLVVAAVDYEQALYREANTYPHLVDRGVTGNPDETALEELHRGAWGVVAPSFREGMKRAEEQYQRLAGTGRTSRSVRRIVPASREGRVETLFLDRGAATWGSLLAGDGTLRLDRRPTPDSRDLADMAARHTLLRGGTVYAIEPAEMPTEAPMAAVLRF